MVGESAVGIGRGLGQYGARHPGGETVINATASASSESSESSSAAASASASASASLSHSGEALPRAGRVGQIGPVGAVFQFVVGWGFTFVFAIVATTASVVTLRRFSVHLTPWLLNFWARVMLRIQRVELIVEGAEFVDPRTMKVALFTHSSLLDAMIVTAVKPVGGVSVIKREALYIPFVGVALWALGFLLIDRGRTHRAKRMLERAAARMERERLTVFIAPEGTRSLDGSLQPFKKGAFHLALVSGAPVVPMLIDGAAALHPKGVWITRPGRIRVRFLPPIAIDGVTVETLGPFCDRVWQVMADGLAEMR